MSLHTNLHRYVYVPSNIYGILALTSLPGQNDQPKRYRNAYALPANRLRCPLGRTRLYPYIAARRQSSTLRSVSDAR
jgi:hypothetical protein